MSICKYCGKETDKFRTFKIKGKEYTSKKCRKCESAVSMKWAKENPDKFRKNLNKYLNKHRATEEYKEYAKMNRKRYWNNMSPDQKKKYYEKRALRVSPMEEYRKLRDKFLEKYGFSYVTSNTFGLRTAKAVYKKFNKSCVMCNNIKGLCIHHKDGVGYGNYKKLNKEVNNDISNLMLVCRKCHMLIHKNLPHLKSN